MIAIALSTQSSDVRSEDSVHPHDPTSGLEELRKPGIIDLAHPWFDDAWNETCTAENASAPVTRANAALALSWAGRPLHRLICTLSSRLRSTICWPEDNNDRPTFSIVLRTAASISIAEPEAPPLKTSTTFRHEAPLLPLQPPSSSRQFLGSLSMLGLPLPPKPSLVLLKAAP